MIRNLRPRKLRPVYRNREEVIEVWNKAIQEYLYPLMRGNITRELERELGTPSGIKSIEEVVSEFDPLTLYPESWWETKLGLTSDYWRTFSPIRSFHQHGFREAFTHTLSFAIPTVESLRKIADFVGNQTVFEYMAGTGYWAYHLRKMNVQIYPTDRNSSHYQVSRAKTFVQVPYQDVSKSVPEPRSVAMFSWIPYGSSAANSFLRKMRKGQKLILIGESLGGCTADDSTFKILNREFDVVDTVPIVQFFGIHDYIEFYQKG